MAARPPPVPPARALLLALAGALLAPREARGVSLWDQGGADEVVSVSVRSGDLWIPEKSFDSKNHPEVLNIQIQLESKELIINLERNEGLIASSFTETHYLQDGTDVSLARNYTGHCYYHGHVRGYSDSAVSVSTCSGLRGLIMFENETYVLEPMKNATNRYKLFPAKNLKSIWGSCGSHHNTSSLTADNVFPPPSQTWARRHKRETLKATKYVELVIVADNREFQRQGKDLEKVKQRLIEIANHVDKFYRPLNIRVVLVGVEVWNDIDKCSISQDPFTSLHEFLDWRKMKLLPRKSHDNAQLVRYPFPMVFSSCSRKDLETSLEKGMGMCLFNLPEVRESFGGQKCGNGFVEEGEQCDCGEPEECMNRCCNATTCTLKPDAVCAHGLCCEDCQLKPAGTACRDSSNSCDLPEFCTGASPHCPANVYLHDGHPCQGVDGYCYNGICQTHEQQCVTLWGPGAKPAPGICFERVNSAGDPYGNCGKVSKSSFAKCEMRDAKCGKIQCQGGASRPVIGTNAVSIETNIPLQEGGRILCRGTHVYLGDDMPDPGLVLAGTKCADGKICLNRQCQNISVFGVHECTVQCHGRGVCNNRKNCHCEAHWAPPFCDKFGFGGSTDSGPIRQADNQGLTVGILVTILCLLAAGFVVYLKRKTLIRLLFTNKKTTIEKLRCVHPSRPPRGSQPCQAHLGHLGKGLMRKPPDSYPPKDNPRRLPQCPNVDISRPLNGLNVPQPQSTQRVLPPLHRAPRAPSVPARPLPVNPALRQAQGTCKPNPPQKPLPADPLARTTRLTHALARTPGQQETGLRLAPLRPAPQYPHQVPRSTHTAYIK
uniref:ADAM metallopeptidase domain 12 n=1 Tax=Papio anubis TaxID=9555 RepID=A0A8I5N213_PAPAN